jgi:RHS repeat-associated protein
VEMRYKPWGELRTQTGDPQTNYRYTGQRYDEQLGIYYYGARWYDPALGRFLSADTIVPQPGNPAGWDRYAYVMNNPVNATDPTGHISCDLGDCRDGGYHVTQAFERKVIKNTFNWETDENFTLGELKTIFASGWTIRNYVDQVTNGSGDEWISKNLPSINFHRDGAPQKVVSFFARKETDLVFLSNDIWLGAGVDKALNPIQHTLHEIGHVFDNNSGKGIIPGIWGGGGFGDRLTRFVGGDPTGIRWMNGSNGIPSDNLWRKDVMDGYGNTSSADYFAEAFSWTIVDSSKVPNKSVANWIDARIVLTNP